MNTLKIKKIEQDGDFFSVEFENGFETEGDDFDLEQLGTDIVFINCGFGAVQVSGSVTLKAGDSITDEFGGAPILGAKRVENVQKNMSIVKESDYRDAYQEKHFGK